MSGAQDAFPPLTDEQRAALEAFADKHGQDWREELSALWINGGDGPALRQVRNTYGPTWLYDAYAWGWTPAPAQDARWSADFPPPALGARVRVRVNGLGLGVVTGYFVQDGWLGVTVKLDDPPAWYVKQNGGNVPGHSFGAEIALPE